ncbi:MAG: hypothetical protein QM793_00335 [Muricomes sp.]
MITNERAMRFLFGLAMDDNDNTLINSETTTFSATYTAFGVDIIDPNYEPPKESKNVIEDSSTGIKLQYEDGTAFDDAIELMLEPKSKEDTSKLNANVDKVAKGFVLGGLYDIRLLKNGVEIQPGKNVKISIPLTKEMKELTDLKVVYIDDDGNVTILPSEIVGANIVFVTNHFSDYGVIGKVAATTPGKEDPKDPTTPGKEDPKDPTTPGKEDPKDPTTPGKEDPKDPTKPSKRILKKHQLQKIRVILLKLLHQKQGMRHRLYYIS